MIPSLTGFFEGLPLRTPKKGAKMMRFGKTKEQKAEEVFQSMVSRNEQLSQKISEYRSRASGSNDAPDKENQSYNFLTSN